MGAVFSVLYSLRHIAEHILTLGVAASAGAFQSFTTDYFISLRTILPFCEPAETEPFEDFSEPVKEICTDEDTDIPILNVCHPVRKIHVQSAPLEPATAVWRSRTVAAKKRYMTVVDQVKKRALRFRRRFDLYGPPDWADPSLVLLPQTSPSPENPHINVTLSIYPFAAPHIVISPPAAPMAACTNYLECQDHDSGNRLIVVQAPSKDGPLPLVINPGSSYPLAPAAVSVPFIGDISDSQDINRGILEAALESDDDLSISGYGECSVSLDEPSLPQSSSTKETLFWIFWIEEDEDGLPELPETW